MTQPTNCPICRKIVEPPAAGIPSPYPFCSDRCRQVDLLRWSKGQYAIVEPLTSEQHWEQAAADEHSDPPDA